MRRVYRRSITTDPVGRPLHAESERIADDGNGRLHALVRRTPTACQGCQRPIADVSELRGRCDHCRQRHLCARCETDCTVCGRRLCGECRRGFVGATSTGVCPICLARLQRRQAYDDQLRLEQVAFDRRLSEARELARIGALRLHAERLGLMADVQGARLRLAAQLADARHPPSLLGLALTKAWNHARQLFR